MWRCGDLHIAVPVVCCFLTRESIVVLLPFLIYRGFVDWVVWGLWQISTQTRDPQCGAPEQASSPSPYESATSATGATDVLTLVTAEETWAKRTQPKKTTVKTGSDLVGTCSCYGCDTEICPADTHWKIGYCTPCIEARRSGSDHAHLAPGDAGFPDTSVDWKHRPCAQCGNLAVTKNSRGLCQICKLSQQPHQ